MVRLNEFPICFPACEGDLLSFSSFNTLSEFVDAVSEETLYTVQFWDTMGECVAEGVLTQIAQGVYDNPEESSWFLELPVEVKSVVLHVLEECQITEIIDLYLQIVVQLNKVNPNCWAFKKELQQSHLISVNHALIQASDFTGKIFGDASIVINGEQLKTVLKSKLAFGVRRISLAGVETAMVANNIHLATMEAAEYVSIGKTAVATNAILVEEDLPKIPIDRILNYSLWQEFVTCVTAFNLATELEVKLFYLAQLSLKLIGTGVSTL